MPIERQALHWTARKKVASETTAYDSWMQAVPKPSTRCGIYNCLQAVDDVKRETGRSLVDPAAALKNRKLALLDLVDESNTKLAKLHKKRRESEVRTRFPAHVHTHAHMFVHMPTSGARWVCLRGYWHA